MKMIKYLKSCAQQNFHKHIKEFRQRTRSCWYRKVMDVGVGAQTFRIQTVFAAVEGLSFGNCHQAESVGAECLA
jgi:hypothetical protein